jgi:hypothetical protein
MNGLFVLTWVSSNKFGIVDLILTWIYLVTMEVYFYNNEDFMPACYQAYLGLVICI